MFLTRARVTIGEASLDMRSLPVRQTGRGVGSAAVSLCVLEGGGCDLAEHYVSLDGCQ